ncbi:MAG TPA: hypothetical protein VEN81_17695 [Planctomycetota bacterium]|nr:hypothetical protein [Planctomycetota bacterium]
MEFDPKHNLSSVGKAPRVAAIHTVAFYDSKSGSIRHLHHRIALEGAQPTDATSLERRALEQAQRKGANLKGTKTLHLENAAFLQGPFRVDVKSLQLVPLDPVKYRPESHSGSTKKISKKKGR